MAVRGLTGQGDTGHQRYPPLAVRRHTLLSAVGLVMPPKAASGLLASVSSTCCARSFKVRMAASLAVRMCGCEEGPAGVSRRGLGVRGGVVVVSLP